MKHCESKEALCPFYRCEDRRNIHKVYCEGLEKGMSTYMVFHSAEIADKYKNDHCYSHYEECRYCKMLYAKYEEIGEA